MGATINDGDDLRMSLGDGIIWERPPNGFYFNMGDPAIIAELRQTLMDQGLQTTIYCDLHNGCLYYTPTDEAFSPGPIIGAIMQ